jgi:hypothetical protein
MTVPPAANPSHNYVMTEVVLQYRKAAEVIDVLR